MSTNAIINVEDFTVASFYKHWDGYPSATIEWLFDFNTTFNTNRGEDPEYKFAQLIRSSALLGLKYSLDKSTKTGWGVISYEDKGIDYVYTLNNDNSITVNNTIYLSYEDYLEKQDN